jgi:hypothetical protein
MIFPHVGVTVGVMLRKVLAVYHPTVIAANAAADPLDAIIAITLTMRPRAFSRSAAAHKDKIGFERCVL